MNWYQEIKPVAPSYIPINTITGLQMIVPACDFRGITRFKDECKVYVTVFDPSGSSYVDSYEIAKSEYERIAKLLGFEFQKEE